MSYLKSVIKPKTPKGNGWSYHGRAPAESTMGFEGHIWFYRQQGLMVISAVEVAYDANDIDKGPEYHISVSKNGKRCTSNEAKFVRRAFKMMDAEEDNHVPSGFVRNFWMPVAEKIIGHQCRCKGEEPAILEDKGDFVWRGLTR